MSGAPSDFAEACVASSLKQSMILCPVRSQYHLGLSFAGVGVFILCVAFDRPLSWFFLRPFGGGLVLIAAKIL